MEIARNHIVFPNGSKVEGVTTADPTTAGQPLGTTNPPINLKTATTVTKGPNGEMPPGWSSAFPANAVVA